MDKKRLEVLLDKESILDALEAGGVDNWDNYDDSLEPYREKKEKDKQIQEAFEDMLGVLGQGCFEPSERGAGCAFREETEVEAFEIFSRIVNGE